MILAMHQHHYVNQARCVLIANVCMECIGSYEECDEVSNGKLTAHAADDAIDELIENGKEKLGMRKR